MTRLLYLSPVHANSYAQRPHFMVRACLEQGIESVLWVNPYPCRLPQWGDLRRKRRAFHQGTRWDERVRLLDVPALPIEPLPLGAWLNQRLLWRRAWREMVEYAAGGPVVLGIGRPCALALKALRELSPVQRFYDAMDNFPEFHVGLSRRMMRNHEDAIAESVDCVLASSTFLADKFLRRSLAVEKLLNGYEAFDRGVKEPIADEARPILGYVGCIGHWFDWPLVIRLAKLMSGVEIELVGPCVVRPPEKLPGNVRLLPACEHAKVGEHLQRFSAGLIPFVNNALTAGVDPIKFYEYRAAGLPVLSTSFGEMALRDEEDGVFFLDRTSDANEVVSKAISAGRNAAEMNSFTYDNTWTSRFHGSDYFRSIWPASGKRRAA